MLVNQMRPQDRVAIVVYAGAAGLVLDPTSGEDKGTILEALSRSEAGGATAGGAGLRLAYDVARRHHMEGGNNRVILATDGDFNVGPSSDSEMIRLIEQRRDEGTFLTVLGFGTGNLQDAKMEQIADHGNGNFAYIDSAHEARKVLVKEFGGTLYTIAKDVKLQVEFNPARVQAYRLIGYENRILAAEDFNDDLKDSGDLGAGHTVTALYEIIPTGVDTSTPIRGLDELRYQRTDEEADSPEVLGYPPPAQVAGAIMNSIFLDMLDNDAAERNPATAHMFIINPLHAHKRDNLFATHPATENRVAALRAMSGGSGSAQRKAPTPLSSSSIPNTRKRSRPGPWS